MWVGLWIFLWHLSRYDGLWPMLISVSLAIPYTFRPIAKPALDVTTGRYSTRSYSKRGGWVRPRRRIDGRNLMYEIVLA